MTQEQKQFIIKALQTGIPAIAREHIDALEEVARIADTKQEELNGQEMFALLNQEILDVTIKTIRASAPYMAEEYLTAYQTAVNVCLVKFDENRKAREEREKADAEKSEEGEAPAPDTKPNTKKKSA